MKAVKGPPLLSSEEQPLSVEHNHKLSIGLVIYLFTFIQHILENRHFSCRSFHAHKRETEAPHRIFDEIAKVLFSLMQLTFSALMWLFHTENNKNNVCNNLRVKRIYSSSLCQIFYQRGQRRRLVVPCASRCCQVLSGAPSSHCSSVGRPQAQLCDNGS